MDEDAIRRRAGFLLAEARSGAPLYCHAISTILRVLSNEVNFGHYSSRRAKEAPPLMSQGAFELRERLKIAHPHDGWLKEFQKETINEHQEELREVWRWIEGQHARIDADQIIARLKAYPPIILTREENRKLERGLHPEERYRDITIVDGETGAVLRPAARA